MAPINIQSKLRMNSGHEIPILGYGLWQTPAGVAEEVVSHALKTGYRHIDSAVVYRNEEPCGEAIRKSGIPRNDIFYTSKVLPRSMTYESTKTSVETSLRKTGLDYIDLYLIHAPYGGPEARRGAWRALVEAQQAGKIRSLGVSNYGVHHLDELEQYIKEMEAAHGAGKGGTISVGQWELHPWLERADIVDWCAKRGVVVEAYCPLVRGQRFDEPILQPLVKKYNKSPAQILLRWSIQKGFVPLPKSVTPSRIDENAAIYDFELTAAEMESLETGEYSACSWDPTVSQD
ncbi:MAG: hypothetical protein M1823_003330 [Watsoniomyces obsoletus]|nr:MAG: hypothetical protein M1823_003330 [Watsoniomyces obsoletus]